MKQFVEAPLATGFGASCLLALGEEGPIKELPSIYAALPYAKEMVLQGRSVLLKRLFIHEDRVHGLSEKESGLLSRMKLGGFGVVFKGLPGTG
jgi:hypothetical protein